MFSYVDAINKKSFVSYKYMDLKIVTERISENKISPTKKASFEKCFAKVATRVENYLKTIQNMVLKNSHRF